MRSKESAVDYRYIAEPNIPTLCLSDEYIDDVKRQMPKSADEVAEELVSEYGVKPADAELITRSPNLAAYFMRCIMLTENTAACTNLFIGEVVPNLGEEFERESVSPEHLAEIANIFGSGKVTSPTAKKLIHMCAESGASPMAIAEREKLLKITDLDEIRTYAEAAVASDEKALADYRRGKVAVIKQFLGSVMRATGGRADPIIAEEAIKNILNNM